MDVNNSKAVVFAEPMKMLVDGLFPRLRDCWGDVNGVFVRQYFFLRNGLLFVNRKHGYFSRVD